MSSHRNTVIAALAAVVLLTPVIVLAQAPATRPEGAAKVPAETLEEIEQQFMVPPGVRLSAAEQVQRMKTVVQLGAEAEDKHPDAPNLIEIRQHMLQAAAWLAMTRDDSESRKRLGAIAERIVKSDAPAQQKVVADFFRAMLKLMTNEDADAENVIGGFVKGYKDTPAEPQALIHAALLARQNNAPVLSEKYIDTLESEHADEPEVRTFLRRAGRHPDIGRPFETTITTLERKKINLPEDLKGKVVVVDFWATWCGPCVKAMPHMKQLYAEYQPKGVAFLGISLDKNREALAKFVKEHDIPWPQGFSGKGWDDPTVQKYGVRATPSVWIIAADGTVFSDSAMDYQAASMDAALDNIEVELKKALAATETQPAEE